ncbi:tRNA (guanosine(37)-N1)-methyltransferase TrmD [candidate division KSB1 bacterium]|nr:tRNA (guanosine(37)-N1)-methyltransferase TrmD [candidate division KSB1 bacterium]
MNIHIISVFPGAFNGPLDESIIKRAQNKGLVRFYIHDLREFTTDKHHQVDDYPYGGGPGMVLKPEPIFSALEHVISQIPEQASKQLIFLTPQGHPYNQRKALQLCEVENLVFLCGHYKAVDERVRDFWPMEEISIGDYVLTGGELPALVIIDSVIRLIPGVISDLNSATTDSFYDDNLLDCPYYTRPEEYRGMKVPGVLLSGHHAEIDKWRKQKSVERTLSIRRDLISPERLINLKKDVDLGGLVNE